MANGERKYTDFSNVEDGRLYLTAEEFPEGSYGSSIHKNERVENKSTQWKKGQKKMSAYTYENKNLHDNLPRQMNGAHPPHDETEFQTDPYLSE